MTMECKDCVIDLNANPSKPRNNAGLIVASVVGGTAVLISGLCLPFVTPALRKICLPYVPATDSQVNNVLKLLKGRTGNLIDLGSGDGRIVHEAAKVGFNKSVGVELNPWLVWYSRIKSRQLGISSSTAFYRKDMWKISLEPYNNVVIFGVDSMMKDLEMKCVREMKPGSLVAACRFPLPQTTSKVQYEKTEGEGIDSVWLYSIGDSVQKNNKSTKHIESDVET